MEQKGAAAGGLKKLLAVSGFLVAGIFNLKSGIGDFGWVFSFEFIN